MALRFIVSFVLAAFLVPAPSISPQRAAKAEKTKDWLQSEVQYLITEEERQVYSRLTTDEERERFIDDFWRRRDAGEPGSFREEFYRRVAYANENFHAGSPGWRTDRGRIYILYGPPNRRDAHPMGGRYTKPANLGGDTITTFPFETWEYDYIPGIGQEISIEFVDHSGTGVYTIETDPNKKDVFYWRRGEQPLNNRRVEPSYKEQPFSRLEVWAKLQAPPPLKFPELREEVRAKISYNQLPFDSTTAFVRMSSEMWAVPVTVTLPNNSLMFIGKEGYFEAELQMYTAVTSITGQMVYQVDDSFKARSGDFTLPELLQQRTYHQCIIPLPAGRYKLRILLKDVNSGKTGIQESSFWIPQASEGALNTSSLICADVIQPASGNSRGEEFVLGPLKVIPNVEASYQRRYRLGLYLEVYDLALDTTTEKPSVEVSYLLEASDGTKIPIGPEFESRFPEGHTMAIAKGIPLSNLAPGKYRVAVRISDTITQRACTLETQIQVL